MSNKSLIIKSPSTIDADLLKYNVLRVFTTLPAKFRTNSGYIGNQKLTIEKIEGDTDTDVKGNGTNNVSAINNSTTSKKRIVFDISPIDAITKVGESAFTLANLKSIMGEGLAALEGLTEITTIEIANDAAGKVSNPSKDTILSGDIAKLKTLTKLTNLMLHSTNVSGDIAELKTLTNLTGLVLNSTNASGDIIKLKTFTNPTDLVLSGTNVSGDIAKLKTLNNLANLWLSGTNASGDIAELKTLTNLTSLWLSMTNVSGDIAKLKTLTNLTNLWLNNTNVSGDIAELKTLTNLTNLWLNSTNVSGDIAELKTLTKCSLINVSGTNVSGDLSVLSPGVLKVSGGSSRSNQKVSWSSPTNRSSKTNIPLVITNGGSGDAWDFGDDVDKLLIDEAACTNYSGNTYGKYIEVKGNRTSASDNAIQTLQNNGWTVKIN